jgi:hypothetical protein
MKLATQRKFGRIAPAGKPSEKGEAMKRMTSALVVGLSLVASSSAWAQSTSVYTQSALNSFVNKNSVSNFSAGRIRGQVYSQAVPNFSFSSKNYRSMFNSSLSGARSGKPFAGRSQSSPVNPWLSMSEPFSNSGHNYYTNVRPQLEQQRANQQAAAQARAQQQLGSIMAQPPYDPQGSQTVMPTGHSSVYMNYGGYFPPAQIQPKRPSR